MTRTAPILLAVLAASRLASASPAVAGPAPEPGPAGEIGPSAHAARRTAAISIDGHLDDAGWANVPTATGFIERQPTEGAKPEGQTEFKVVYDDTAIYVAVRCFDAHPDKIRGLLTRRDQSSASDWVMIGFDSYHDKRTAFVFGLNAAGVQRDGIVYDDSTEDYTWDAVWSGAVAIDDQGWTAELRIPLSQIRFSGKPDQDWGFQIVRLVPRNNEMSSWSLWPVSSNRIVSHFGTLDSIEGLSPKRRIEILPYASTGVALSHPDAMDPFGDPTNGVYNAGLDVKYGLGSAFTLAATINPDFGQVEADPSQVNLSGQQTFFPEKRPFFTEGTDLFQWSLQQGDGNGGEGLFYTRRIGAAPHLFGTDYANYADEPAATTIYGAAKVSGKTASGWSIGLLEALTAKENATLSPAIGSPSSKLVVEPLTNYAIVRVKKDLRGGNSTIAGILTAVDRQLDDPEVTATLHDQAYTGGFDGTHRFGHDEWQADARLYGSYVHGSPDAILADQTSIIRLFQRPDASYVHVDPTRTSLSGEGLLFDVGRMNDKHWNYATGGDVRTPGLELNDMGFQQSADGAVEWAFVGYRHDEPSDHVLAWNMNFNGWASSDFKPEPVGSGGNVNASVTLPDYWGFNMGIGGNHGEWNPQLLRGGPRYHAETSWNTWVNVNTDSRKPVIGNLSADINRRAISDSWSGDLSATVTLQARSNIDFAIGPSLSVVEEAHQYVDQEPDTMGDPRYLFARLHEVVTALTVRASWTFSPTLSLQFYAQPFIASGAYSEYKEPNHLEADPYRDRWTFLNGRQARNGGDGLIHIDSDQDGVDDYVVGKPDFDFREMHSNLVLRWEYRPGSTVFLIWSHERSNEEDLDGRFRLGHDLGQLAGERGEHVIMVKANYWMGL